MYSIHYIIKKILFPRKCIGCGTSDQSLCFTCLSLLPIRKQIIRRNDCTEIQLFPYTHKKIAKIIWELKYKNNADLRRSLFSRIGPEISASIEMLLPKGQTLYLISVPKARIDTDKERDFDHGALLARALEPYIKTHAVTMLNGFLTKKEVGRQATQKKRSARIKQMHGAIIPTSKMEKFGRSVLPCIIIDDVTTTGATRDEMIRVLKKYFTGPIVFIALAH